ncbi:MAG: SBBP repeat-containing protein, partial [Pirellula sp.]
MEFRLLKRAARRVHSVWTSDWAQRASDKLNNLLKVHLSLELPRDPNSVDAILLEDRVLYSATPFGMFDPIGISNLPTDGNGSDAPADHASLNYGQILAELENCVQQLSLDASPLPSDGEATMVNDSLADTQLSNEESTNNVNKRNELSTDLWSSQRDVVFVLDGIADLDSILDDLHRDHCDAIIDVFVLSNTEDGFEQMESILSQYSDLDSIQIVSHGANGMIQIGSTWLTAGNVAHHQIDLERCGMSLGEDGDIFVYGCNLNDQLEDGFDHVEMSLSSLDSVDSSDVVLPGTEETDHISHSGQLLQFVSDGHVLGFQQDSLLVASLDHALQIDFVDANTVAPSTGELIVDGNTVEDSRANAFTSVTYAGIWDGVTAVYEAQEGAILKSTYYVDAGLTDSAVDQIRLHYNREISLDDNGNLVIAYDHGVVTDSAPIAWQDIDGHRVFVEVQYILLGNNQVGFDVGNYDLNYELVIDPTMTWSSFLGGAGTDTALGVAVDSSGNVYVTGSSTATWGSAVRAYSSGTDAFVAKLNSSGTLVWNTFLGAAGTDTGRGIAVDSSGNVFVAGDTTTTWGSAVRAYTSGTDTFAAKLNSSGNLVWNTFLGGSGTDAGRGITIDNGGNVYVAGDSTATWGTPVRAYTTGTDAYAAKLNSSGTLVWDSFLGGTGNDNGRGIAVDSSGNVYVTGDSNATWGSPVRAFTAGSTDAYAAKLDSSGTLNWNTFLGSSVAEFGYAIAIDTSGNVYVTGSSAGTWGTPVTAHTTGTDAYIAKLNSSGNLTWNTFAGGTGTAIFRSIVVESSGNIYVAGDSTASWGSPVWAKSTGTDATLTKFNSSGTRTWHTYIGGTGTDNGYGIAIDVNFNAYVVGGSTATWGTPVRAYTSGTDAFVTKIAVNESPVLADTALSIASTEDAGSPSGIVGALISTLIGGLTDLDNGAVQGIAITASVETNGTWYYTTNNGTNWNAVGTVSAASSLLLADNANTRLYFAPNANYNGTSTSALTIRGWDQTSGTAGTKVSTSSNGGVTAFSSATDAVNVAVTAVNDAPVASGSATLSAVNEDSASPTGATISSLFSSNFSDSTDSVASGSSANTFAGIAISSYTVDATKGQWQYSTNTGSTWTTLGNATTTTAITLDSAASTMLRFVPTANYNGAATGLSVHLIESGLSITNGATINLTGATGDTTHISAATIALNETITATNDTPVAVVDYLTALEAGGVSNGTAGTNPTGNVLTNDTDVDSGDTKTVSGVAAGVHASAVGSVGSSVTGSYGSITIASTGTYTYAVDNSNATVQALRTISDTITDVFTYTMQDTAGLTSTTQITVTIQGANDAPHDLSTTGLTIAENSANTTSVGTISRSDADNGDTPTYSLIDSAGGRFTISASTGAVTVANSSLLNYEVATSHSITVRITDLSGASYDEVFTVNLTDVDEFDVTNPIDTNATTNNVDESVAIGTIVNITANAGDADATTNGITYSLFGNDGGNFAIDTNTGIVTTAALLNRETVGATRNITVRATSPDGSTADTVFTINIHDLDEFNTGAVTDSNATANSVAENAANGTVVGVTGLASDPDAT